MIAREQRDAWREIFRHYVFDADPCDQIPAHRKGALGAIDERIARGIRAMLLNRLNR